MRETGPPYHQQWKRAFGSVDCDIQIHKYAYLCMCTKHHESGASRAFMVTPPAEEVLHVDHIISEIADRRHDLRGPCNPRCNSSL